MIKLTKEIFSKLPQLDRIEFRQKEAIVKEIKANLFGVAIMFSFRIFIIGSLFIGLCWGGESMLIFMNQFSVSLPYIAIFIGFAFLGDIYIIKKRIEARNKLIDEYFDVKVESKRGYNGKKRK